MRGKGYTKTAWQVQERPVSSSKLNTWDDRIEQALERAFFYVGQTAGDENGVLRGATSLDLKTTQASPAGRSVVVNAGCALIARCPYRLGSSMATAEVTPPATYPRVDLVQARLDSWDVSVRTGTEAASPMAPEAEANCIALAELHLRPGMVSVKDTDDGVNGYIVDVRAFL